MRTSNRRAPASFTHDAPGRNRRFLNKAKTRQAILDAALALFAKKGFRNTTTREIAKKAGIAEGTMVSYFRTKEDLALYFFDKELTDLIQWYEDQPKLGDAPLAEQLFAMVNRHLERIAPYEDFIGAVYLRALHPGSKLHPLSLEERELSTRYLRFVHEILLQAEDRKEIPKTGQIGAYTVGLFHVAMVAYWLNDMSRGKENTLALLDRCLKLAHGILRRKGGWDW